MSGKKRREQGASPLMGGLMHHPVRIASPAHTASPSSTASSPLPHTSQKNGFKRQKIGPSDAGAPGHDVKQQQDVAGKVEELQARAQQLRSQRMKLPIWSARQSIVDAVKSNDTVVLLAETGSGKTTQVPQFLHEAGLTRDRAPLIGVTQPRRVAATSLASRVAAEMGEPDPGSLKGVPRGKGRKKGSQQVPALGRVAYAIRFDDRTGPKAAIRFMTDGLLLREVMGNAASRALASKGPEGKGAEGGGSIASSSHTPTHSLLDRYSVLIIDEAHERTVDTDLLLGLVKRIQAKRKEAHRRWKTRQADRDKAGSSLQQRQFEQDPEPLLLKVVVMSATLDAEKFSNFFSHRDEAQGTTMPAPILYVQGRTHKVRLSHTLQPCLDWTEAARTTVFQIHTTRPPGDVLVFGTGAEEIDGLCQSLASLNGVLELQHEKRQEEGAHLTARARERLLPVPLYAALGPLGIAAAFAPTPPGFRKIIVATNIAETSITLPNIRYVVDCGLAKERGLKRGGGGAGAGAEARKGGLGGSRVTSLDAGPISKSAADQRAGRAGRTADGDCFRLYTLQSYEEELAEESTPEVERTDLTNAFLALFSIGIMPQEFEWISRPEEEEVHASIVALSVLGAIEPVAQQKMMRITELGCKMAGLPLPAALARTLIAAAEEGPTVARQARDLVAILSSDKGSVLYLPPPHLKDQNLVNAKSKSNKGKSESEKAAEAHAKFAHPTGDHATQLTALYAYLDAQEGFGRKVAMLKEREEGTNGFKRRNMELKAWCEDHYVSFRNVKQVLDIRKQIDLICKKAGIACDDHQDDLHRRRGDGQAPNAVSISTSTSATSTPEPEIDRSLDSSHGLYVTRGGVRDGLTLADRSAADNYEALRRCLLKGRPPDFAIRQADGSYVKDGDLTLRIHPSSFLFGHNTPAASSSSSSSSAYASSKPSAIIFDELLFTTQYFARTVSAIEPAELANVDKEIRDRPALAGSAKRLV